MNNKKKILIISASDLKNDPRVYRQIEFLKDDYDIKTFGLNDPEIEGVKFVKFRFNKSVLSRLVILFFRLFRLYGIFEKFWLKYKLIPEDKKIYEEEFELLIANEIEALPIGFKCFKKTKILLDLHEYAPREFEDRFIWRFLYQPHAVYQCKKYLKSCDAIITVCEGIANEYKKNYCVNPDVITNARKYFDLKPGKVGDKIRIIHHGAAISSRKIELMIELIDYLDERFSIDFMLTNVQENYYKKLIQLSEGKKRVNMIPPVDMVDIVEKINQYDIGLFILPPTTFNYNYALPNKFFEFIQARLAIAIGPSPEMSKVVKKYDLGVISKNFEPREMAKILNSLASEQIYYYKTQSDKNAYILSKEENGKKLRKIVFNLIGT